MQFFSMLTFFGAIVSMIAVGSAQLNSRTGCLPFVNNPVTCIFSWIFFTSEESASDNIINCYINTSSCEKLLEGGADTMKLGANATIPASKPGLTLPLTLTNPFNYTVGPVFKFNGTTYDIRKCTCGVGPKISAATGYACSCPIDCSAVRTFHRLLRSFLITRITSDYHEDF